LLSCQRAFGVAVWGTRASRLWTDGPRRGWRFPGCRGDRPSNRPRRRRFGRSQIRVLRGDPCSGPFQIPGEARTRVRDRSGFRGISAPVLAELARSRQPRSARAGRRERRGPTFTLRRQTSSAASASPRDRTAVHPAVFAGTRSSVFSFSRVAAQFSAAAGIQVPARGPIIRWIRRWTQAGRPARSASRTCRFAAAPVLGSR